MKLLMQLLCCLPLVLGAPAWAQLSQDDAAAAAQRATGGRVLSVERADSGGRPAWRVKVVTARGEVRFVLIDIATGRPL